MPPNFIQVKPQQDDMSRQSIEQADEMYDRICDKRFNSLEESDREQNTLLREIHAKVTNGFGTRIENTDRNVSELKLDTNEKLGSLRDEMDRRFDHMDKTLDKLKASTSAALITIAVGIIGGAFTVVAAVVTGLFGLLDKIATIVP